MSRYYSYLNSAEKILDAYDGKEPFALFLKKYFSLQKKFGSKDRKMISYICYSLFRLGKMASDIPLSERIKLGLFLCSNDSSPILELINPGWNEKIALPIEQKLSLTGHDLREVFPWKNELSDDIDLDSFCRSFFIQPDLFIRIRPGFTEQVLQKVKEITSDFEFIESATIRLPNGFKADQYFDIDRELVIQDYSSQKVADFFPADLPVNTKVWDCCAASGGKSIMAVDHLNNIELTVSDIRESILANLQKRFRSAGINNYRSILSDLSSLKPALPSNKFDLVIADVPCSGSGTWGRTPEQLYYFDASKIEEYASLQKKIISNILPSVSKNGYLLYITCSVFKKENEEQVQFILDKSGFKLIRMEIIRGYNQKADTMFAALLKNEL
ncbi:MAG TPA: methyltransferase domain-containing protein [Chitinophagaceae bacterium]|mgnify:CR=1 FL=1|nr:methyltransferase domain-containing protein [Chitinophagaceae bacterium]